MYFMIILEASVFPAPDSPEIIMQVSRLRCFIVRYAASAMANKCGEFSNNSRPGEEPRRNFSRRGGRMENGEWGDGGNGCTCKPFTSHSTRVSLVIENAAPDKTRQRDGTCEANELVTTELTFVLGHLIRPVDVHFPVRIHRNTYFPDIRVDLPCLVSEEEEKIIFVI